MMEAFFKDLVCHGDAAHNDSMADSGSDGESPSLPRSGTMVMTSKMARDEMQDRKPSRCLKKEWAAEQHGQMPVWEDVEPVATDEANLHEEAMGPLPIAMAPALESFDFGPPKIPAITRIPKDKRLSFPDENTSHGVNTIRAGHDPETDRCKAMDIATKQAAARENAARAMLNEGPPKRGPGLGGHSQPPKSPTSARGPTPPKKNESKTPRALGFGTSSRRLDSLPAPPMHSSRGPSPLRSSRTSTGGRCETPEPQRGSGAASPSPMQNTTSSAQQQKLQGAPPTPRGNNMWGQQAAPPTPQRQKDASSFVLGPGPPRCPSMSSLSPQTSRAKSNTAGEKRRNSYVQRQESFSTSNGTMGAYTYRGEQPQRMQSAQYSARFPPAQSNSYIPPPSPTHSYVAPPSQTNVGNSWVPPPSMSRNNSYVPPPPRADMNPLPTSPMSTAMVVNGSRTNLSPEAIQYPNSMEKVRDAGLAFCARLFQPPPRTLSFEAPQNLGFAAFVPPSPGPPRRMMSSDRTSPAPTPPPMPFPLTSAPPPALPNFLGAFEAMVNPVRQRQNSYEPPLIRH